MPTLNKEPDNLPLNPLDPNTDIHSSTLPKPHRKSYNELSTSSLPRQPKSRLPSVLESQQLNLNLAEADKPPLPPKPSPPLPYSKYIITPQPYRRLDDPKTPDSPPSRLPLTPPTNSGVVPSNQHDQPWYVSHQRYRLQICLYRVPFWTSFFKQMNLSHKKVNPSYFKNVFYLISYKNLLSRAVPRKSHFFPWLAK